MKPQACAATSLSFGSSGSKPDANRADRNDNAGGKTVGCKPFVQEESADQGGKYYAGFAKRRNGPIGPTDMATRMLPIVRVPGEGETLSR